MDGEVIAIVFNGVLMDADLKHLAQQLQQIDEEFPRSPDRFADFSHVTEIKWNFDTISAFAKLRRQTPPKNEIKVAMVAPLSTHYGFARMYQSLMDGRSWKYQIFKTLPEARQWLGEPKS